MRINYLGHSSFLITTNAGTRIVTDPLDSSLYEDGKLLYRAFNEAADIVTISHEHRDHSAPHVVKGSPVIIKSSGKFAANEVEITGVDTYHDDVRGEKRGKNIIFIISVDGLRIAHLGDLGHVLKADQAAEIGAVDIALVPVGGFYTIDACQADKVTKQLEAKIIIPMHYKTEKCLFPIDSVDVFINGKSNVIRQNTSTFTISKDTLPKEAEIVVLDYSL